jgi:outer membrane protein OmpA-like peptidoglycan-associated protein
MARLRRVIFLVVAMVASATSLFAQRVAAKEEVVVYYRHDKYSIDRTYMSNGEAFATLDSIFNKYGNAIDSIAIVAYASPEGRHYYNMWLSKLRAANMKGFLRVNYPSADFSNLKT